MKRENSYEILLVLSILVVHISVKPVVSSLSYENKDFVKIKQDPTRFQQAFFNINNRFAPKTISVNTSKETVNGHAINPPQISSMGLDKNYSHEKNNGNNKTGSTPNQYKKWQVGRVSRKQYEIINMLWRKTKIFVHMDQTTASYYRRRDNDTKKTIDNVPAPHQAFLRFPSHSNLPLTTPSYIEFYYLDESEEHVKDSTTAKSTMPKLKEEKKLRNNEKIKFVIRNYPMFAFRIENPTFKQPIPTRYMHPTNRLRRRKLSLNESSLTDFNSFKSFTSSYKFPHKRPLRSSIETTFVTSNVKENITINVNQENVTTNENKTVTTHTISTENLSTSENSFDNETCPVTTTELTTVNNATERENFTTYSSNIKTSTKATTVYDKIKFFEMYDKHTPIPYYDDKGKLMDMDNFDIIVQKNEIQPQNKILLEHVDQMIGNDHSNPHKAKHAKKHIIESYNSNSKGQNSDNLLIKKVIIKPFNVTEIQIINVTKQPLKKLLITSKKIDYFDDKKSKPAVWSKYPFAAVYVYEPSQVHCDAAGISPHWLITSGACLSRHHKKPGGVGRSAFVAYCGDSWWNPERVAYVKYSVVHPRFHLHDRARKHLYNIGLVQVVNSMASACNGWAPISLMSHQFVSDVGGSIANAIGWGLDRFDTRYSSSDLPKSPLMSYESQVFSDSCPGNVGYNKAKRLDENSGIKNVLCLSLPPYSGEETDPVHGGLLILGGKLVALYLQEERRPWGEQCAQYTGTWRLVPWVLNVARENYEVDAFTLEI